MNNREQLGLEIAKLQGALDVSQTQMSELQKDLNVAQPYLT